MFSRYIVYYLWNLGEIESVSGDQNGSQLAVVGDKLNKSG